MLGENGRTSNVRISVLVHSRYSSFFQICQIDKYWRIPYVKVSSHDYLLIYARTPEDIDEYSVFAYSKRIDICVVLASD